MKNSDILEVIVAPLLERFHLFKSTVVGKANKKQIFKTLEITLFLLNAWHFKLARTHYFELTFLSRQ